MNHPARLLSMFVLLMLLSACSSMRPPAALPAAQLFSDASFGPPSQAVDTNSLFALSEPMRAYLHSPEFRQQLRRKGRERGLLHALYEKGQLRLEYDASVTRNAAETFDARMGNCLSLVLMTAAFAKELGMEVQYNDVVSDDVWTRNAGMYFTSTHVNLTLISRDALRMGFGDRLGPLTVDFVPSRDAARNRSFPLTESEIKVRFLNNRAAEALAAKRLDDAYWWARAAVELLPSFATAQNTLGVVYQSAGHFQMAERTFKSTLMLEPDNTVAMHNLVPVLNRLGKQDEAGALQARLQVLEPVPPFHWFNRGMAAMNERRYTEAKSLFAREVRRAPYNDEFHFWLAVAHWHLGETGQAREQLSLALDNSTTHDASKRYSAKLASLRAQAY